LEPFSLTFSANIELTERSTADAGTSFAQPYNIQQGLLIMHEPLIIVVATAATWFAIFAAVSAIPGERPHHRKY
jgi:hypothetical protein